MARRSPFIENQAGSPERSIADWIVRLRAKAAIKVNATSGAAFNAELARLTAAYGQMILLDEDTFTALNENSGFSLGFTKGFEA